MSERLDKYTVELCEGVRDFLDHRTNEERLFALLQRWENERDFERRANKAVAKVVGFGVSRIHP